ncbi:hypothetical protein GCM10017714_33720 [Curtobacterium pusillum]|uniref:Uncharacterized protein n=1 Tax=Curtobacterium pusillum TaxID=69373 RepID=A0ABX2M3I5_9MICO|nr:hypothetical protein [Curtobacterium pusillum]NUU12704.1 hypothetical protein [Curtobacterium pusillum]GLK31594.1 hypothetical protein GCM10017610_18790 [Curtobacterium pusillum]
MGAHERTATVQPIWHTRQRWLRTALQTALAFLVGLAGSVAVLQVTAPRVLDALADVLPASWLAWLGGAFAFVIAIASALAKLMAIPVVNAWLARLGFGSVPRSVALDEPEPTTTAGYPDADKTEPDDALG